MPPGAPLELAALSERRSSSGGTATSDRLRANGPRQRIQHTETVIKNKNRKHTRSFSPYNSDPGNEEAPYRHRPSGRSSWHPPIRPALTYPAGAQNERLIAGRPRWKGADRVWGLYLPGKKAIKMPWLPPPRPVYTSRAIPAGTRRHGEPVHASCHAIHAGPAVPVRTF